MAWPEKGLKLPKISYFGLEMKSHPWAPLPVFLNYCGLYEAEGRSCLEVLKIGPKFRWHFNWKLWNRQYQCSWAVAHELMSAALRCTRSWCTQRSEGHWMPDWWHQTVRDRNFILGTNPTGHQAFLHYVCLSKSCSEISSKFWASLSAEEEVKSVGILNTSEEKGLFLFPYTWREVLFFE